MPSAQGHTVVRRAAKAGADGVRYWFLLDIHEVRHDPNSGLFSPAGINVTRMRQRGDEAAEQTATGMVRYRYIPKSGQPTPWAVADDFDTVPVAFNTDFAAIEIAYLVNGATVDTTTVPYIAEGKTGPRGLQGCILRTSEWAEGVKYHNDEALDTTDTRYLDVVVKTVDANNFDMYKCVKTHVSNASITTSNTTYWQKINEAAPIYTPLIIAQYAMLRFSQTNQLVVMDDDGETVLGGFGGGENTIWVGDSDGDSDNWFYVTKYGALYAVNVFVKDRVSVGGFLLKDNGIISQGGHQNEIAVFNTDKTFVAALSPRFLTDNAGAYEDTAGLFKNELSFADGTTDQQENVALRISAANNFVNVALFSDNGDFIGIRPKSRVISATGTFPLYADDHVVIVNTTQAVNVVLPSAPKNNQLYIIRKLTSTGTMTIRNISESTTNIYTLNSASLQARIATAAVGTYRFIYSADLAAWVQL